MRQPPLVHVAYRQRRRGRKLAGNGKYRFPNVYQV